MENWEMTQEWRGRESWRVSKKGKIRGGQHNPAGGKETVESEKQKNRG